MQHVFTMCSSYLGNLLELVLSYAGSSRFGKMLASRVVPKDKQFEEVGIEWVQKRENVTPRTANICPLKRWGRVMPMKGDDSSTCRWLEEPEKSDGFGANGMSPERMAFD